MKIKFLLIFLIIFLSFITCQYSTETYKEGKLSFESQCAACHGMNAEGLGTLYPGLTQADYINAHRKELVCWIHKGIGIENNNARKPRHSDQAMPAMDKISAIELCNILNYLNARFWNLESFQLKEIEDNLSECH